MLSVSIQNPSFGEVLLSIVVMAVLSLVVFRHASKHGSKHATAWGIAGFFWPGFIVYFVRYWLTRRRF